MEENFQIIIGDAKLISLRTHQNKYISAWPEGLVDGNRDWDRQWEQFYIEFVGLNKITLKNYHGFYLSTHEVPYGEVICDHREAGEDEIWTVEVIGIDSISLKSRFGKYFHVYDDGTVTADSDDITERETFVFTKYLTPHDRQFPR